jgi:putative DNA primase/helicase
METLAAVPAANDDMNGRANPPVFEPTELGNAKRFVARYRGEMLYVPDNQQWFHWDERLWKPDTDGNALRRFESVIDDLRDEQIPIVESIRSAESDEEKKHLGSQLRAMQSWYRQSQRVSVMRNSLVLAGVQSGMTAPLVEFDKKGQFFGCANGIIDLRDGSLITGDKRFLMTKASSVAYRPDAICPQWDKFLLRIMEGDVQTVGFLQRLVGQAMFGTQGKDKLTILWGSGANGKSTFVDALHDVFGQYATVTDPRMLMDTGRANKEYYLADLKSARLVLMSETKRGDMIAESIVKMLVDGGKITARFPAGRVFTFQPVFTPILSTNHRPRVGSDPAIWRRVLLIPFTHTIPEAERNPKFRSEVLKAEHEGILRWAVEGAMAFLRDGLAPTGKVVEATEEYKRSQDKIGQFLSEECTLEPSERTQLKALLDRFNDWSEDMGFQRLGRTSFKEELLTKGFEIRVSTGHVDWVYEIANRKPVSDFPHLVPAVAKLVK